MGSTLVLTVRLQLGASCLPCPPPTPLLCSAPTQEVRKRDAEPWCRSAETVATATTRVKLSVGDRRRQSWPDDFGDVFDSLDEERDSGLLQVRRGA